MDDLAGPQCKASGATEQEGDLATWSWHYWGGEDSEAPSSLSLGDLQAPEGPRALTARSIPSLRNHYMLLVFVKVPILLVLVGVVLRLKEPRSVPKEHLEQPIYTNSSSNLTKDTIP